MQTSGSDAAPRDIRIAAIHAVYAAAWSALYCAGRPGPPGGLALGLAIGLTVIALVRWAPWRPAEKRPRTTTGRHILLINGATASAVVLAIVWLHAVRRDDLMIAVVVVIMGFHFAPLWRVLRRPSLLWMGGALILIGLIAVARPPFEPASWLAGLVFALNSLRLVWMDRRR